MRQGALKQILVSVDRSTRLVRQLLTLAKLDAGLEANPEEEVCLGEVLDAIINTTQQAIGAPRVTIAPALHAYRVCTNRDTLGIALRNLHENAMQHTPENGEVTWAIASDGQGLVLEDEGPGIPPEELSLVSQRFFRGKYRTASGCGLGLAIVEAVLKQIGGRLILENRCGQPGLRAHIVFHAASPLRRKR